MRRKRIHKTFFHSNSQRQQGTRPINLHANVFFRREPPRLRLELPVPVSKFRFILLELLGLASLLVLALLAVLVALDRSWTTFSVLRVAAIKCFIRAKLDLLRKTAVPRRNP